MISPSKKSLAESSNFFLPSVTDSKPRDADTTAKIQKVVQDAHTLHKLAQAYDVNQFLNESPGKSTIRETDLSAIAGMPRPAIDTCRRRINDMLKKGYANSQPARLVRDSL
ncbi:hypothetical protein ACKLNR_014057 [Fusarium oxysporum f. sp. zingiberi]